MPSLNTRPEFEFSNAVLQSLYTYANAVAVPWVASHGNTLKAQEVIQGYIGEYDHFAKKILADIQDEDAGFYDTQQCVAKYAHEQLVLILKQLKSLSDSELEVLRQVVASLTAYIGAAQTREERVAMLGHAMARFRARLRQLAFLATSTPGSQAVRPQVSQATQYTEYISQATQYTQYISQAVRRSLEGLQRVSSNLSAAAFIHSLRSVSRSQLETTSEYMLIDDWKAVGEYKAIKGVVQGVPENDLVAA